MTDERVSPGLQPVEPLRRGEGSIPTAPQVTDFEAANGGAVFLDQIGELPVELQRKLLRAIEAREISLRKHGCAAGSGTSG